MKTLNPKIFSIGLIICMTILSCAVIAQNPKNSNVISRNEEKLQQRLDERMKKYQARLQNMDKHELELFREQQALNLKNELEESVRHSDVYIKNRLDPSGKMPERPNNNAVAPIPKQGHAKPADYTLNTPTPIADSLALVALYVATNGNNWYNNSNWLSGPVSSWYGIETDQITGEVVYIDLSDNNLVGEIPDEIGNLTNLEELYLSGNYLTGTIPSEIENLTLLQKLFLSWNELEGAIPVGVFRLNNLLHLDLSFNKLSGTISSEIENLTLLESLFLGFNELEGNIPDQIGALISLWDLNLCCNKLDGEIPVQIGNLTNLSWLYLNENQLTGTIPSQIENLTSLQRFHLGSNELNGNIPVEIGNLGNLKVLYLDNNQLTGTIPYQIGNLTNLEELRLNDNLLTDTIPFQIGNLTSLSRLELCWNKLEGRIPDEIGDLGNLKVLYLDNNQLTGTIPSQIGNLTNLEELYLNNNQLTGAIPSQIGNLTSLFSLDLSWNKLEGEIPAQLFDLNNLEYLNLFFNRLTGEISPQIENLTSLEILYLSWNQLEGDIPDELFNLTNLSLIDFSYNHLTGIIPSAIKNLSSLQHLNLGNNSLEGDIPEQFWDLTNLNLISIYGNSFTGTIPPAIGNLSSLKHFDIGNNNFEGILPYELSLLNLNKLSIEGNNFEGEIPYDLCNAISVEFRLENNNFGLENCNVINCLLDKEVSIPDGSQKNGYNLLEDCSALYVNIIPEEGYLCSEPYSYFFGEVIALNYDNLIWYTDGDGDFDDEHSVNPTYYPGVEDIINGYVYIVVEVYDDWDYYSDDFELYISETSAGPDLVIQVGESCYIEDAFAINTDKVFWESTGTGYFDNNQLIDPTYYPGVDDINAGSVTLILTTYTGDCIASVSLVLSFDYTGEPDIEVNTQNIYSILAPEDSESFYVEINNLGNGPLVYEINVSKDESRAASIQKSVEEILINNQTRCTNDFSQFSGLNSSKINNQTPSFLSAEEIMKRRKNAASSVVPAKIICVVDSYGSNFTSWFWDELNATYGDIIIDYATLSKPDITYNDLVNSGAEVLIIDNAWNAAQIYGELTTDEINAIIKYVDEGKGLIVTAGTLNSYLVPNHNQLAPLLGLNPNVFYEWNDGNHYVGGGYTYIELENPVHPVFKKIYNPFVPGYASSAVPDTRNWHDAIEDAEILAISSESEAAITAYRNRVYLPYLLSHESSQNDSKLMYNSINFCANHPSWLDLYPLRGEIEPTMIDQLEVNINSYNLPAGLYYATISINSNDPDESPLDISVTLEITEGGIEDFLFLDWATISFDTCYAANITIYVGGNWYVVEENAFVKFEAGQNIIILPGTHFKEGSMVHARIVTDGIYCALPMMAAVNTQPVEPSFKSMIDFPENKDVLSDAFNVLVYPNPTNGCVMLEFSEPTVNTLVEVYGLIGERVLTKEINGSNLYELDLSSQLQGIYLVKVSNGNSVVLKKIIKK